MPLLSEEFLSPYRGKTPTLAGVLFYPVYLRTYSRWLEDQQRRERWDETVQRVTEYSMSLYQGPASQESLKVEAEQLYDTIFNLRVLPAGRSLWVGGTKSSQKFGESQFNCFSGDTEFLTPQGYKKFNTFQDGEHVKVLGRFGGWKDATVRSFGTQKLFKLTLRRGTSKTRKEIFVTSNHRWLVRPYEERYDTENKLTSELVSGDLIPITLRKKSNIQVCSIGLQHGMVFGDGTYSKDRNYCSIALQHDSQQFSSIFSTGSKEETGSRGGVVTGLYTRITNLPSFWKTIPDISGNSEYLLGFLMGWFGADGSISKNGSAHLSSAVLSNLEWAKSAFALLGIETGDIRVTREKSPYDGTDKPLYDLCIYKQSLTEEFFLKDTHKLAFSSAQTQIKNWTVVSVEETDRVETVWCVQEPEDECFVLSGGVLTRNCSFRTINDLAAFTDLFHLLLCGCGVGFRVLKKDIATLPNFEGIDLRIEEYAPIASHYRAESTTIISRQNGPYVVVGDSREGWVEALRIFLNSAVQGEVVTMDFNNVRPAGERIKTFGGLAPGPEGIMEMFKNLARVINNAQDNRLSAVDCMDICNYIGKNVIVGGTRRSSQVTLGDPNDQEFLDAKKDLWSKKENLQRTMSNNSVVFKSKPTREQIANIFTGIKNNGEPGFFNLEAAKKRRPNAEGSNPCMEISMDSKGFCNLTTVNLMAFVDRGFFNIHGALQAVTTAVRIGTRMTNVTVSLPDWDAVQKRDRLLGVSITGVMDAFDALGIEFDSQDAKGILSTLREVANKEARDYAFEMRIPAPLLVTTIKPEGTLSQLPTVSSGLHRAYAPHYIRRIRVSSMDPVCKALQKLGVPNEPDKGKAERIVFSFPIKTEAKTSAADEPAKRQFERYLTMMDSYVDHNASCTLTIGEDEWEEMEQEVYDNFDKVIACAFLPKYTDAFPQMPYEEITESQYKELMSTFPSLDTLPALVNSFEIGEFEDELEDECKNGYCPVR